MKKEGRGAGLLQALVQSLSYATKSFEKPMYMCYEEPKAQIGL